MKTRRSEDPWYIDLIARIFCLFATLVTGSMAYTAHQSGHPLVAWGVGFLALAFLVAATIAPRHVRVGLIGWLPGF